MTNLNKRFLINGMYLNSLEPLFNNINVNKIENNFKSIIIQHIVPNTYPYLKYINKIFPVALVIAIPYSANKEIVNQLNEENINTVILSNMTMDLEEIVLSKIEEMKEKEPNTKLLLQDVEGYFSPFASKIMKNNNIKGIVEDTEFGHRQYEKLSQTSIPILSVARSSIKSLEDTLIGRTVVFSLEKILKQQFNDSIEGKKSLVLGYGKIGESVAAGLRGRNSDVAVYDINPIRNIKSKLNGYRKGELKKLVTTSDIIVGATGTTSLGSDLINKSKENAYICSASNKNIEFDLNALKIINKYCSKNQVNVWECQNLEAKAFYLLNEGYPINFNDNSMPDKIIYGVFLAMYYCMVKIAKNECFNGFQTLSKEEELYLGNLFQKYLD